MPKQWERQAELSQYFSRYAMPKKELGEYDTEPERRRSAPARPSSGMLFPLAEEGSLIHFRINLEPFVNLAIFWLLYG